MIRHMCAELAHEVPLVHALLLVTRVLSMCTVAADRAAAGHELDLKVEHTATPKAGRRGRL